MTAFRRRKQQTAVKNPMKSFDLNTGTTQAQTALNPEEAQANSFFAVLQRKELQNGLIGEINQKLIESAMAAARTGKKSSVSIQIILEPKQGALNVSTKLTSKVPQEEEELCIFYPTENGLTRDNPNQRELPLRAYSGGKEDEKYPASVAV